MKSSILGVLVGCAYVVHAHAIIINEVLSNPIGDDSGREWIELYNDTSESVDVSALTISIKGGNPISTFPLQGGTIVPAGGYVLVGSTVSGQTKFLTDYATYDGILFRSSLSLVNSGSTSLDIYIHGVVAASLPSYTAAKEGNSLSYVNGSYIAGVPTPGQQNQASETSDTGTTGSSTVTTTSQVSVSQMSPPSPDVVLYLPEEKTVVAGASSEYSSFGLTRSGRAITDLRYSWAFGDGGQGAGSSTQYTYAYPGRYVTHVEAINATVFGTARMVVRVVPPDIEIKQTGSSKYGAFIDVHNPNPYMLDFSQWGFSIDGAFFPFPKNTAILPNETVRFSGKAMGFASTTITASTTVRILFPNMEEVTRFVPVPVSENASIFVLATSSVPVSKAITQKKPTNAGKQKVAVKKTQAPRVLGASTSTEKVSIATSSPVVRSEVVSKPKDTRIVAWLKLLFR